MMKAHEPEFNFNFGTKPTTSDLDEIKVKIDPTLMLGDFAVAYEKELYRRNPTRAEQINLTAEELETYFKGIIAIRVKSVNSKVPDWRQAKELYIPTWIQFVISQIGQVIDTNRGLIITPVYEDSYDISSMLDTSSRLRAFEVDGVSMHKDAFPRDKEGDQDMMTMAVIGDYVKSMSETPHPIQSYVSAFIGAKLEEEAAFKVLYRVRYDDVKFIRAMLLHEESLI